MRLDAAFHQGEVISRKVIGRSSREPWIASPRWMPICIARRTSDLHSNERCHRSDLRGVPLLYIWLYIGARAGRNKAGPAASRSFIKRPRRRHAM